MADVYDEWYGDLPGAGETVACVQALAVACGGGPVLELGVGTGRLSIALAEAGLEVWGVDASAAMLARLSAKPGGEAVHVVCGDMADPVPGGPFTVVFAAFNTFFNLTSQAAQERCLASVAATLVPGGAFVIEAFVPAEGAPAGGAIDVRALELDRVVLSISRHDPHTGEAWGQHVELTEIGGVRLRPWRVRYCTPSELDELAAGAGLTLESRSAGWQGEPFTQEAARHVSIYRR
jgi:SAM-dependent methyltransferase